jgi:ketosteroid isomerase-like protein
MKNKATMTSSFTFFFFVCLIFNSCTQAPIDVTSEITEANKGFMEAFNNGDANALSKNYTSNAKLYPSNSDVIEGQEAIEGFWNAVMTMGINKALLKTVSAESFGDIAIEEGRYELYVEGDQIADQGKYIVIWEKEDGQWKLHQDIWNTSNPAPQSEQQ